MAFGGLHSWELLCPVCKTFIETNDLDLQSSLDYHYLNVHPTLRRDIFQSENKVPVLHDIKLLQETNVLHPRKDCTNYLICPVCDNVIEILQNNINHCFMEHFEICHQSAVKLNVADNVSVQRTGHQANNFEKCENNDNLSGLQIMTSKIQSLHLSDLPTDLEKHRGYIILNNTNFLCHICRETLNTQQIVIGHLKTKRHEDNVVIWLKDKLSEHMNDVMEFVSFYGSNLCCNLCRCRIEMNSNNPHETLLNIISHNTSSKHIQNKPNRDTMKNSVGCTILQSITQNNALINEHRDFIEVEMTPHLKCKLCEKIIHYNKNYVELELNCLTHINSILHKNNSKATTILQFFKEMYVDRDRNHGFYVLNGSINCTQCKSTITSSIEQLLEHCQSNVNGGISQLKKYASPKAHEKLNTTKKDKANTEKSSVAELTCTPASSASQLKSCHVVHPKINTTKEMTRPNIDKILQPLHNQFGNITCIAENGDGNLTCMICNCPIQPMTRCVKIHLMGKFHKNKTHCQIKELKTLNLNNEEIHQELNVNNRETPPQSYQDLIDHLFQPLPQRFHEEKDFFTINLTDGSVNCILCDCVLDPLFIEVHLQEEAHLRKKQVGTA